MINLLLGYTAIWAFYDKIIPLKRYQAVVKESGKTNYIEKLNNIMWHKIPPLVIKPLSFLNKI